MGLFRSHAEFVATESEPEAIDIQEAVHRRIKVLHLELLSI